MRITTAILVCAAASCVIPSAQSLPSPETPTEKAETKQGELPGTSAGEFVADIETESGLRIAQAAVLASDARIRVETRRYTFEGARGLAWHVRVGLDSAEVSVAASTSPVAFADLLPADSGSSWAAVNGGFYDRSHAPMGLAIVDGITVTPLTRGGGSGVFEVRDDGLRIVHRDAADPDAEFALQSIDRIADGGASLVSEGASPGLAARSAVALTPTELVFVVLADERSIEGDSLSQVQLHSTSGLGLPLYALADYVLETTGASEVLNLDGSVSTQLAANIGDASIRVRGVRGTPNAVVVR